MNKFDQLKRLNNKSAIIARGIMDYFQSNEPDQSKLRACQAAALEYAQEMGADITGTSLTSKIAKDMRDAGVFQQFSGKPKRGEGYVLEPGPKFDEFSEFIEDNEDYGTSMQGQAKISQIRMKSELLDHIEARGGYRINGDTHPTDSATYNFLRQMLNDGKLDAIFVPAGITAAVKHKGKTKRVEYWDD